MLENGFFGGVIVVLSFLLIYTFIKTVNFRLLKIYFGIVELFILSISILYLMENEELDLGMLLVLFFCQGLLIYFIKVDYKKECVRKDIYLKISQSHFIPLIVMGIPEIKEENINKFLSTLDYLFGLIGEFKKSTFCFFKYEEELICFQALFLRKSDMYLFVSDKEFLELDIEEVGKGGYIKLKAKCDSSS